MRWLVLAIASLLMAVGTTEVGWKMRDLTELSTLREKKITELESNPQNTVEILRLTKSIDSIENSVTSHASLIRGMILFLSGVILMNFSFVNTERSKGEQVGGDNARS